jgi:hypothetical protein
MKYMVYVFLLVLSVIMSSLQAEKIGDAVSLKGYSKFVVFPKIPVQDKVVSDKVQLVAEQCFGKAGKVHKVQLIVSTPEGTAVNLEDMVGDGVLIYEINNVVDEEGSPLGVVKGSLIFSTSVSAMKTKSEGQAVIWSSQHFLKGNLQKDPESFVQQSLNALLEEFSENYKKVNSSQPIFNLYS